MSIFTLPSALRAMRLAWGQRRFDLRFENGDSGSGQSRLVAPPRWTAALSCPDALTAADAAVWRALVLGLNGRVNQLALYDLGNPAPRGTMRGTLTLASAASAGATSITLTGGAGQAATTLLQADWLGLGQSGSQRELLAVAADATADGSGLITVSLVSPLRWAYSSGASVVWDKPTALFRQTTDASTWTHERAIRTGYTLDLMESWE